jgi:hypothetical protein
MPLTTSANFSKSARLAERSGFALEERNHFVKEAWPVLYDTNHDLVGHSVRTNAPAPEYLLYQAQYLSTFATLGDAELRHQLKSWPAAGVASNAYGEAPLSVDVTRDVAVQPFLLIVRARHVVTIVNVRPDVIDE